MKKLHFILVMFLACILNIMPVLGQSDSKNDKVVADSKTAKAEFLKKDALMKGLFESAYGYVIFPNVGKGGIGVGGAAGNGVVYEKDVMVGMAKLSQVSIGLQAGGQAYREIIFFE